MIATVHTQWRGRGSWYRRGGGWFHTGRPGGWGNPVGARQAGHRELKCRHTFFKKSTI